MTVKRMNRPQKIALFFAIITAVAFFPAAHKLLTELFPDRYSRHGKKRNHFCCRFSMLLLLW